MGTAECLVPVGTQQLLDRCSHLLYSSGYLFSTITVVLMYSLREGKPREAEATVSKSVLGDPQVLKLQQGCAGGMHIYEEAGRKCN